MKRAVAACLALSVSFAGGCAEVVVDEASQPILGGIPGSAGQFPTALAIFNGGMCSATLIDPSWVLTAAHCITPQLVGASSQQQVTDRTDVIFDAESLFGGGGGFQIGAADTIPHPSFSLNGLGDNDIGLIRLSQPITDRAPTPINRFREDAPAGIVVTQVGYGQTEVGNQNSGGRLFYLESKTTTSCGPYGASDATLLCWSQSDGSGKCQGDSGGPSFATINGVERIVGVTSFGDQTCQQFGADTRVDAELEFLFGTAPELQCQADGACNDACGQNGLPADSDCSPCTSDSECDGDKICDAGACITPPFGEGGLGSDCAGDNDCESGLCGMDAEGGTCTQECSDSDGCPSDFECIEAGDRNVCWPESGGCSTSGGGTSASALLLLAALALLRRRRER